MFILTSIFVVSLIMLSSMIGFRLWELKNGKIPFPDGEGISRQLHVFTEWEKKAWEESRQWSMRFLSLFLRLVIIVIDKMRKWMRHTVSSMEEALVKKNPEKDLQGTSSFFLKDIAEHKKKIRARFNKGEKTGV
ncbi:MAG: hypothetical protein WCT49_04190 [Candidatus Paceibacterota bacterium]|jgi:hypothetical protein|nr:hypothetical protein [Candidatus Paceibacterota bacterium]